mgnify:CR=1 FL=1
MKIDIITLFPNMFKGPFDESMMWKAKKDGLLEVGITDLRDFGIGPRKQVDDVPYGGGAGMVLKPEPLFAAIQEAKSQNKGPVILLTPRGKVFSQKIAHKLAEEKELILVAGHYEGYDERVMELVDMEISIGDYVLTGGELPAMVLVDGVVRLIPGVLGNEQSNKNESFSHGLLEHPQYTRPESFEGKKVPEVLLSGHHAEIEKWRKDEAFKKTKQNRPDILF